MASAGTPATVALARAGIAFRAHAYELARPPTDQGTYGEAVAAALGIPPGRLFKTLVAEVDTRAVVGIVPVDRKLNLKVLAAAAQGKQARMADPADAERLTGYVTGGISPLGQKRRLATFVDDSLAHHPTVLVSGGRRGLQVELDPGDLVRLLDAQPVHGLAI